MAMVDTEKLEEIVTTVFRRELEPVLKRLDAMDSRFDTMDSRLDVMDKRFDAIDDRFDSIDERFDDNDTKLNKILNVIGEIQDEQAGILAVHTKLLGNHKKRIEKLERHSPLATL